MFVIGCQARDHEFISGLQYANRTRKQRLALWTGNLPGANATDIVSRLTADFENAIRNALPNSRVNAEYRSYRSLEAAGAGHGGRGGGHRGDRDRGDRPGPGTGRGGRGGHGHGGGRDFTSGGGHRFSSGGGRSDRDNRSGGDARDHRFSTDSRP